MLDIKIFSFLLILIFNSKSVLIILQLKKYFFFKSYSEQKLRKLVSLVKHDKIKLLYINK